LEVIPAREFNFLYIYLDSVWLLILFFIFIYTKRYMAIIAGLAGAAIYFIVDYGIFYLLLGTRTVSGANPATLLLWLSISYGFTNFAWIWLWLDRDSHALEWSILIISGWFTTALLSKNFGSNFALISIQRGTSSYHGVMALILLVGYSILIIKNIKRSAEVKERINIFWILSIGVLVQFSWEAVLLISGIRNPGFMPLIVNSLLETNLGLPYLFLIHRAISTRFEENLHRKVECVK
jgi:hypothetical protein